MPEENDVLYILPADKKEKAARLYELAHLHALIKDEETKREIEERIERLKAVKFD